MTDPDVAPTEAVEALLVEREITTVLYGYCRGLDRMDRRLVSRTWHPGARVDYGGDYVGTAEGFVDWVFAAHARMTSHSHQITNVLAEVDGDTARSESYVTVGLQHVEDREVLEVLTRGRYLDRWSRRDGQWAVDARRYVSDLSRTLRFPAEAARIDPASRRDADDPSYRLFA